MMNKMKTVVLLTGFVVIAACGIQPPAGPATATVTQPSLHTVRVSVPPSTTPGIWGYRFTFTPLNDSPHPAVKFDAPTPVLEGDASKWLPGDGTPYSITVTALKDNQESAASATSSTTIAVKTTIHPAIAGTPDVYSTGATATQIATAENAIAVELINAVNAERTLRGMTTLVRDPITEAFVKSTAKRNAAALTCTSPNIMGPTYPNTCHSSDADTVAWGTANYPLRETGENSVEGVSYYPLNSITAFMNSTGHRNTILSEYPTGVAMGIACDVNGGTWVLMATSSRDVYTHSPLPTYTGATPQARTNWNPTMGPYPGTVCPSSQPTLISHGTPGTSEWTETVVTVG